jgi:hypothetical protein
MMRDQVGPELRALGLTGSGSAYVLPSETHWAVIGVQKSRSNTTDRVRFTINLTVVPRDVWARAQATWPSQLSRRPAPNMDSGGLIAESDRRCYWHARIGMVMPGTHDTWWEITPRIDTETTAREVVSAVREFALPALRKHMTGCA